MFLRCYGPFMREFNSQAERLDRTNECLEYQRQALENAPEGSPHRQAIERKIERMEDEKALLSGEKQPIARSTRPLRAPRAGSDDAPLEPIADEVEPIERPALPGV